MKNKTALHIASDCVRHVMKETLVQIAYKYITDKRKETLEQRVTQFNEVLIILDELADNG